ncbi:MAG: hypothetical protein HKN47_00405 [Pirellulaceae bacterium]|nr:hypothetical protein [Pirellulaceae bacterium]
MRCAQSVLTIFLLGNILCAEPGDAKEFRSWQNPDGNYSLQAKFVTADDDQVVLEQKSGELVVLQREQLSAENQKYLDDLLGQKEAGDDTTDKAIADISSWNLSDGSEIQGRLIGFGRQTMVVVRERGKLFVNGFRFDRLPAAYRKVLPDVVAAVDEETIKSIDDLEKHLADGGGGPFEYVVEGIQLKLEEEGAITVPITLLAPEDASVVAPYLQRWRAAQEETVADEDRDETDRRERLMLDSYAKTRSKQTAAQRRLKMMELGLLATASGITDIWEVTLYPNNRYGYARSVVVPARNSLVAQKIATTKYPGWRVGPIRKLSN